MPHLSFVSLPLLGTVASLYGLGWLGLPFIVRWVNLVGVSVVLDCLAAVLPSPALPLAPTFSSLLLHSRNIPEPSRIFFFLAPYGFTPQSLFLQS